MAKKQGQQSNAAIAEHRRARHEYTIEETFEAGIVLEGWEVKSLRLGRTQITESYVIIKQGEIWWLGGIINPLPTVATHTVADANRTRKLLLKKDEIRKLVGAVEQKGFTLVPLKLYWKKNHVKLLIALAKGKKMHDKRQTVKSREWDREKAKLHKLKSR